MTIRIAPAYPSDATILSSLTGSLIEEGLPHSWTESRILGLMRHPECSVITARDGRRLAGFASMQYLDEHAHLNLLAVRHGYRQQGIGRSLLAWLEACAMTAGTFEVRLELRSLNTGALAFYERLGYRQCGVSAGYYSGMEDAVRLVRDLRRVSASH